MVDNFRTLLGITCETVIAEYGTVISIDGKTIFPLNIEGVLEFRDKLKSAFSEIGWTVEIGDSATWVRERKHFRPNRPTVIFDGLREQSVGLYIKQTDGDGALMSDADLWKRGNALLSGIEIPKGLRTFDPNPKYDITISNAEGADKTLGYHALREIHPTEPFFMIGDGYADIIEDASVVLCAVGNAVPELKSRATFVSKHEFTAGLEDCLLWINNL